METQTGIDYGQESIFQDSQNRLRLLVELAQGADVDFDPNAVGVYNLGVYVYSLKALCWPLLRSAGDRGQLQRPRPQLQHGCGACVLRQHQQPEQFSRGGYDWFWFVERPHERGR